MNPDHAAELGNRLKEARQVRGLTQKQLGRHVGVTAQSISNYEAGGKATPSLATLLKITAALNVPPSQLLDNLADLSRAPRSQRYADQNAIMRQLSALTDPQMQTLRALLETLTKHGWGKPIARTRRRPNATNAGP
ncbi:helix-turn-helix transcriptional regulator [Bosea sp. CS1GBMeth4]|uniref:helix-turn-helix transcriptional regulator n=1 Tax=Bosea sp. CS1GBMeth4 TaxID=1892849 RepID=UPI00164400A4|nr:helix-turn-helix transcriptional regulator [Bosea sp. CS1GBMeth4]